jgi:hypothetical protein
MPTDWATQVEPDKAVRMLESIDLDGLKKDRGQLFAESVFWYAWVGLRFVCRVTFTAVFIFVAWLLLAFQFPIFQVHQIIVAATEVLDFGDLHPNGRSLVVLLLLFFILPIGLVLALYDRVQACRRDGAIGLIPSSIRMLGPLIAMVGVFCLQMGIFSMRVLVAICIGLFAVAAFILLFPWSLILLVLFGVISAAVKHGVAEGMKKAKADQPIGNGS